MKNETTRRLFTNERKFNLGRVMVTTSALYVLSVAEMDNALQRHNRGDWGDVGSDDWESNDLAIDDGSRLLSVYQSTTQTVFLDYHRAGSKPDDHLAA